MSPIAISKSATFQTQPPETSMKSGTPRDQRSGEMPLARIPATSRVHPTNTPHCRPSPRSAATRARTTPTAIATSDITTRSGNSLGVPLKISALECEIAHCLLSRSTATAPTKTGMTTRSATESRRAVYVPIDTVLRWPGLRVVAADATASARRLLLVRDVPFYSEEVG